MERSHDGPLTKAIPLVAEVLNMMRELEIALEDMENTHGKHS